MREKEKQKTKSTFTSTVKSLPCTTQHFHRRGSTGDTHFITFTFCFDGLTHHSLEDMQEVFESCVGGRRLLLMVVVVGTWLAMGWTQRCREELEVVAN